MEASTGGSSSSPAVPSGIKAKLVDKAPYSHPKRTFRSTIRIISNTTREVGEGASSRRDYDSHRCQSRASGTLRSAKLVHTAPHCDLKRTFRSTTRIRMKAMLRKSRNYPHDKGWLAGDPETCLGLCCALLGDHISGFHRRKFYPHVCNLLASKGTLSSSTGMPANYIYACLADCESPCIKHEHIPTSRPAMPGTYAGL
ncbi:hypothetical protein EJ02DRAFT_508683 [Clathrospora elynae]|uniref:Uncharacterized protein n=1 Tax=Clathrospora elynae TaxID=706981 RepID=A0A6A5T3K3_9PLEO|nr:hypothetical protein EJ02DRAFT_508683 [Clathrospora elynae]